MITETLRKILIKFEIYVDRFYLCRGKDADTEAEFQEISANQPKEKKNPDGTKKSIENQFFKICKTLGSRRFLRPFSIAGVIYLLVQWTGVSTMVFYMTHIFRFVLFLNSLALLDLL